MHHKLIHNRQIQVCAALIAADCLIFTLVNPQTASAPWLIIGFSMLGLTFLSLASPCARSLVGYGERVYSLGRRFMRYGALLLITLIGLQSIGQLTLRDVLALGTLGVVAYLYVSYSRKLTPDRV